MQVFCMYTLHWYVTQSLPFTPLSLSFTSSYRACHLCCFLLAAHCWISRSLILLLSLIGSVFFSLFYCAWIFSLNSQFELPVWTPIWTPSLNYRFELPVWTTSLDSQFELPFELPVWTTSLNSQFEVPVSRPCFTPPFQLPCFAKKIVFVFYVLV